MCLHRPRESIGQASRCFDVDQAASGGSWGEPEDLALVSGELPARTPELFRAGQRRQRTCARELGSRGPGRRMASNALAGQVGPARPGTAGVQQ